MDSKKLKDYIINNRSYENIIKEIGCHSIKDNGLYFTFGLPDGDNKKSTVLYKDTLVCNMHTRAINGDVFDLVSYCTQLNFFKSVKYVCDLLGLDYYGKKENVPKVLKVLEIMNNLIVGSKKSDDEPVKAISEGVLSEYVNLGNSDFLEEGIDYKTQIEFEIGFCPRDHLITIPIRDEIGNLVGVKARQPSWIPKSEYDSKYIYIHKCPKTKIVYGLDKAYDYIKEKLVCYVFESEKSVMKAWSLGIKNCVAIGGHSYGSRQVELLERLGVEIVTCFDKDVLEEVLIEESSKFLCSSYMLDLQDLLGEKDSPIDLGLDIFKKLDLGRIKNDKNII